MAHRLADLRAEFSVRRGRDAFALLGPSHPLTRALCARAVAARQAVVALCVLAGALFGLLGHVPLAADVVSAAAVVLAALCAVLIGMAQWERRCARALVAEGFGSLPLALVAAEVERLRDPRTREGLARSLERTLDTVERWERIPVASRPPAGALRLREVAVELHALAEELREPDARVRGLAAAALLLGGGYASPLYEGRIPELRIELARIRYLLVLAEPSSPPGSSRPTERLP